MKRTFLLVFLVIIATFALSFSVSAEESFPVWETNAASYNVNDTTHLLYQNKTKQTVAFEVPFDSTHISVYEHAGGLSLGNKMVVTRMFLDGKTIFVVTLEKNTDYVIELFCLTKPDEPFQVLKKAWKDSDFRRITPDRKEKLTIAPGISENFLFSVSKSGFYTLIADGPVFSYNINPYPDDYYDDDVYPTDMGYWFENECFRKCCYFEAGVTYEIEVFGGSKKATESFSVVSGCPSEQYGIVGENVTRKLSNKFESYCYILVPIKDGKHIITHTGGLSVSIFEGNETIESKQFFSPGDIYGVSADLKKGHVYKIGVTGTSKDTNSFSVYRYTSFQSAELKVLSSGGQMEVVLYSEPNVAAGVGVKWSVSDPSVFEISQDFGCYVVLTPKKQGSAVIKAEVGGITKSITVSTEKKVLTLKENVKTNIYGGTNTEPSGLFTPSKTGKYRFTIEPLAVYTTNTSCVQIEDPGTGNWIGDTGNISKTKTLTLDLKAGVSYKVLLVGSVDITIAKEADSPAPVTPTEPKETTPSNQTNNSTQAATEPADVPPVATQPNHSAPDANVTEPEEQATQGVVTPDENKPEDTTPQDTIGGQPGNNSYLTDDMIQDAINNQGDEESIHVPVDENSGSMQLTVDSLLLAASQNKPLVLHYPDNTGVVFGNQILMDLSAYAENGNLILDVKETALELLADAQKKALDGYKIAKIITVDLTANGEQIHYFNDTVQLTFDNPDPSLVWKAIYVADDGSIEEMKTLCEDKITVFTDHFSCFALVCDDQTVNQNGGSALWIILGVIAVIAAGTTAAYFILKKKDMLPSFLKK